MDFPRQNALVGSLLGQLPESHRNILKVCQLEFKVDETRILLSSTVLGCSEVLDDIVRAEWSIGAAIIATGLPDRFTVYVDNVPRKQFQASQAIRKTKMRLQQAQDSLEE